MTPEGDEASFPFATALQCNSNNQIFIAPYASYRGVKGNQ